MKIRDIEIKNPVIMAPMAGITNMAFRKIVKEFGAGLVYSNWRHLITWMQQNLFRSILMRIRQSVMEIKRQ